MKVNIYYGGRGLIEDATIYVINKITEVLEELMVEVTRYNLYEDKNGITTLPKTLKEADGIILATSVEWFGIGGLMHSFLDACWLYSDKEYISKLYMMPVVMASTHGEKEGELTLIKSWDMLGGIPCDGLCAYVEDSVKFETNADYAKIIEKKAEQYYRTLSQKIMSLPSSDKAVIKNISKTTSLELTPQESEYLSMYVSNENYVKKQKEDIRELTDMFKELLSKNNGSDDQYVYMLKRRFNKENAIECVYQINFSDGGDSVVIDTRNEELEIYNGEAEDDANVILTTDKEGFMSIVEGKTSLQRAFMSGVLSAKGQLDLLNKFDEMF